MFRLSARRGHPAFTRRVAFEFRFAITSATNFLVGRYSPNPKIQSVMTGVGGDVGPTQRVFNERIPGRCGKYRRTRSSSFAR
jgi:hypothetical protein